MKYIIIITGIILYLALIAAVKRCKGYMDDSFRWGGRDG